MCSVVKVQKLKLYEPPLIMDTEDVAQIVVVDDFAPEYLYKFPEDIILDRKTKLHDGEMWSIFVLDSRECIRVKLAGGRKKK